MVSRLILTLVLVSSVTGCMPEETTSVNQEEQESRQTQNRPDDKAEELYLPGQELLDLELNAREGAWCAPEPLPTEGTVGRCHVGPDPGYVARATRSPIGGSVQY